MPPRIDTASRSVDLGPHDPAFLQNPYAAYSEIRAKCPVFFWRDYGFWCLAAHEDVAALFRDKRFGRQVLHVASRAQLGWPPQQDHMAPFNAVERHSLLELEPPDHTRLRKLINRAFVSRQVERLRPRIALLAHKLIDTFEGEERSDLITAFATPIPVHIIAELLGIAPEMAPYLLDWSHKMVAMYQFGRNRASEDTAVQATQEFVAFIRTEIAARRGSPRDDLLSELIQAEADGERLSEDEMISTVILLLNAGHEASVHAIGNGVKALLEAETDTTAAFASPDTVAATVEELLRLDPPLHMFTRYALEPVRLHGIDFRLGDKVGLLLGAANRDPKRFPDPDRLNPARGNAANHVSFGGGIHFCVGAPLARLELQTALPILFSRLPHLKLAAHPQYRDNYHFHGLERLDVILHR